MDYKQALVLAELIDKLVTANIEYLNNYQVRIEHLDGSKMFYKFACSFFLDEEYALIITEHHGMRVYDKDVLLHLSMYNLDNIEIPVLDADTFLKKFNT